MCLFSYFRKFQSTLIHFNTAYNKKFHFLNFMLGRKVAIDASMSIYQFLIAVRQDGSSLMNADGETTR